MLKTDETRRVMGPGADGANADEARPLRLPVVAGSVISAVRVFDVLLRRIEAVKADADKAWEAWKDRREDLDLLHRYVRLVKRAARLKEAAVMDLGNRAEAFAGIVGGAR